MSGWMVLTARRREVGRLGTVLVLGATGMSGALAVRAALALGADRVVAAGRDPEALERLQGLGALPVSLNHDGPDALAAALATAVDQAPPTLVLDFLWGTVAEAAFAALAWGGMGEDAPEVAYVQIGSLAGARAAVPAALLRSRRIRVTGSGIGSVSKAELLAEAPAVMALFADETFQAPYTAYPLDRVGEAWAHQGRTRAVVVPD
ncbi:hypothetical protein HFP72_02275 [Nocardiopsis sp. ARC36]